MTDYNEDLKRKIWNRLRKVDGKDPELFRLDAAGALIEWGEYGKFSPNGWQVDHAFPKKKLEKYGIKEEDWDYELNIRPFNSANNELKDDNFPRYIRSVYFNVSTNENLEDGKTPYIVNREVQKAIQKHYQLPLRLFGNGYESVIPPRKK